MRLPTDERMQAHFRALAKRDSERILQERARSRKVFVLGFFAVATLAIAAFFFLRG